MVKYDGRDFRCTPVRAGEMTIEAALNEVVFFILKGKLLPVGKAISNTSQIDFEDLTLLGDGSEYALYADDGMTRRYTPENLRTLTKSLK